MTKPLTNMQVRDIEALLHPYTNPAMLRDGQGQTITSGEGVYVQDADGRRYIEAMAGLWCCGLGFGNEELVEAASAQMRELPYYHLFGGKSHEPAIALAETLKDLLPGNIARVFYQSSGSEANDTQVKLAWYYNNAKGRPEKKKIISRVRGYHGVTIVSASMTGLPYNHRDFDLPVDRILHTSTPHHWKNAEEGESEEAYTRRLVADLEALIAKEGADTIAAFIAEPVMGAGGVIPPPKEYFPAIAAILKKHDILLISDEVICGFGRTGNWFGAETFQMEPDSFSMAKQLTAGYAPLSAVAISREMTDAIEGNAETIGVLGHGYTYGGHPVSCAVGLRTLEIYQRDNIVEHVRKVATRFAHHLDRLSAHPLVGEARYAGLMGALELSPDGTNRPFSTFGKVGPMVAAELLNHGVIVRAIGETIAFCPPMIIEERELDQLFAAIEPALDAVRAVAARDGLLD